jgi:hypothetical protein
MQYLQLPGGTDENLKKLVRVAGHRLEIWARHHPNMKQGFRPPNRIIRWFLFNKEHPAYAWKQCQKHATRLKKLRVQLMKSNAEMQRVRPIVRQIIYYYYYYYYYHLFFLFLFSFFYSYSCYYFNCLKKYYWSTDFVVIKFFCFHLKYSYSCHIADH